MREGDLICLACGTNLLTGQKIAEERKQAAVKSSSQGNRLPYIVGAIISGIIIVGVLIFVIVITRDPVAKAKRLAASGRATEAIDLLDKHVVKNTDDAKAFFELGKLHWALGDFAQAASNFEKASRLDSKNREAAQLAVVSYGQVKSPSSREAQLTLLQNLVQSDPSDSDAAYLLALAKGLKQDYAGEIASLEQAAASKGGASAVGRASAIAKALQNDVSGAEKDLNAANATDPDSMAAAGIVSAMKGDAANATAKLQDAVKNNTSIQGEALTRLGLLLIDQANYGEALNRLDEALKLDANNAAAKYFRAVCMDRQHLTAQAQTEFEALSEGTSPYQGKAAIQAARLALTQKKPEQAVQILNRVASPQQSDIAELETIRGRAQMLLNDPDSAKDSYRKALQADSSYAPAHLENGLLLVQRQDLTEGVRELERYLKLADPKDPDAGIEQVQALIEQLKRSADKGRASTKEASMPKREGDRS